MTTYAGVLTQKGYDRVSDLANVTVEQLISYEFLDGHAHRLVNAIKATQQTSTAGTDGRIDKRIDYKPNWKFVNKEARRGHVCG